MSESTISNDLVMRALLFSTLRQMSLNDQIGVLDSAGWSNPQIGTAVGLTANAVKLRKRAMKDKVSE